MTHTRALIALLLSSFLLIGTACTSTTKGNPPPAPTVTVTSTPTPDFTESEDEETSSYTPSAPTDDATLSDLEQAFADDVSANVPALSSYADEEIVYLGTLVCADFDKQLTVQQVLEDVFNIPGIDGYGAGYFTGDSVGFFCPEYGPLLDQYLATASP